VDRGSNVDVKPLVLRVQLADRLVDGERGAHGALGVVLVSDRRPEERDDGVADELLHRAAVGLELLADSGVVRSEPRAHVLGVELLRARGRADDVGE
jgi:hypothetical protein